MSSASESNPSDNTTIGSTMLLGTKWIPNKLRGRVSDVYKCVFIERGDLTELTTIVVAIMTRTRGANGEYTGSIFHPTVSVCIVND